MYVANLKFGAEYAMKIISSFHGKNRMGLGSYTEQIEENQEVNHERGLEGTSSAIICG